MATKLVEERSPNGALKDRPTAELLKRLSDQIRDLAQQEIRLARTELTEKGKRAGRGAGLLGGAAVTALYGVGVLLAAIVLALALVMPGWAAALIVAAVLLAAAAIMSMMGRAQTRKAVPPKPERAVESMKKDVQVVREKAHHH
ncbi:phage holin family protein [Thermomonospora umbrina]|uniref:Putative superfamily III holin-X n=1 Tax=Thermomonospora umbrina TaxID=111806 RepID=A0A3D9SGU1_9ACTN|nr:phage holin family protein [Thermomonospora umbrina]REE95128.1 putative superfamily III holin-X [Thermomonospora umbrina]